MDVCQAWDRIKAWCQEYEPEILDGLNSGATEDAIDDAEREIGVTFPEDLRELYRRNDGQNRGYVQSVFWYDMEYVALDWQDWERMGHYPLRVAPGSENFVPAARRSGWIALTPDGATGVQYFVDCDPAPDGTPGQILCVRYDNRTVERVATSLAEGLTHLADGLEKGDLAVLPGGGPVVSREEYEDLCGGIAPTFSTDRR